jgi:hypothetical protein
MLGEAAAEEGGGVGVREKATGSEAALAFKPFPAVTERGRGRRWRFARAFILKVPPRAAVCINYARE